VFQGGDANQQKVVTQEINMNHYLYETQKFIVNHRKLEIQYGCVNLIALENQNYNVSQDGFEIHSKNALRGDVICL